MKKIYFLVSTLIVVVYLGACSQSENLRVDNTQASKELIINEFKSFNDSLFSTDYYVSTRGFWDSFKRGLVVSAADIGGAGGGIAATKEIVGLFGAVSGGTGAVVACGVIGVVCGAGASIAAAQSMESEVYSDPVSASEVIDVYYEIKDSRIEYVRLDFPEEFEYLNLLGGLHNSILKNKECSAPGTRTKRITRTIAPEGIQEEGSLEMIDEVATEEFQELEQNILSSVEFRDICTDIIDATGESYSNGDFSVNTFFANIDGQPTEKERMIYDLYLELFKEYPNNVNDVVYIANEYIRRIEKMSIFTKSEKENLYLSLSVSVNSAYYWNQ